MGIYAKTVDGWVTVGQGNELPGIGSWATIEEVSGTYTKHTYEDWVAYEWTDDGELKTTQDGGIVDALLVSAASPTGTRSDQGGHGGGVIRGIHHLDSDGPHPIVIGVSGKYASCGSPTIFNEAAPTGGLWNSYGWAGAINNPADYTSTGLGGFSGNPGVGVMDDILGPNNIRGYGGGGSGDSVYGGGNPPRANSGGGSTPGSNTPGASGICIIRVPKEYADKVTENFFRWISYATVENGVVTKVTKTPDNQPYTASAQEVECDAHIQEGYLYENGEFTAPEPDYSEEIEALTARLEELRNV